ncbi:chemotaxis protein CheD [Aquabacterium sp.]|uniref:chemotaxis protein CheD n=1 Tax=Aquabacterium sp. TaxID=1872578 RepID=UPI002CFC9ABF|nr:chemotaxis protein CheD [Aquabacterium sp.]HSW03982.1 chemotaxis protein CheD [Aquabacterium sp.]
MKRNAHLHEVLLQPGQWWFGGGATRVRTVLGSCVAVTLWHPRRQIGGMCHYLLPRRGSADRAAPEAPGSAGDTSDGRYGDEVLMQMVRAVASTGSTPVEYEAKLFGGGRMFRSLDARGTAQVPDRNVQAGRDLLLQHGFACKAEHVGGYGHREVVLDVPDGQVWLRHTPLRTTPPGPDERLISALGDLT